MRKKIVFLTGAGVSKESGINTFRDSGGLWEGFNVEEVASPKGWKEHPEKILEFYNTRRKQLDEVQPNSAHIAIAELEKEYDVCVVTQNVDDLYERAGSTNVIHLHGELKLACSSKNKTLVVPYDKEIKIGDLHPDGSQLRPFIVWFGEAVPELGNAKLPIRNADYLVIVGTSLEVYPAANLWRYCLSDRLYRPKSKVR
jgi:NAD-dependent deacetylase